MTVSKDGELSMSGTVLRIARTTEKLIVVSIRETSGNVCDLTIPFDQIENRQKLAFNLDDLVTLKIIKLPDSDKEINPNFSKVDMQL